MELFLSIIAIVISIASTILSFFSWKKDRKMDWYWNVLINPISEQIKKLETLNETIKDNKERTTEINRIFRIIKKKISFLEISYSDKKINKIDDYIENEQNKIISKMFQEDENYIECINNFEIELFKKISKIIN